MDDFGLRNVSAGLELLLLVDTVFVVEHFFHAGGCVKDWGNGCWSVSEIYKGHLSIYILIGKSSLKSQY